MSFRPDLCAAAARNNAIWCDAMARGHGAPGEFADQTWLNPRPAPRLYPNLITLNGPQDGDSHGRAIRRLMASPPAPRWAVKDSFATLDLVPLGFHLLFEARWIHRPADAPERAGNTAHPNYAAQRVTSDAMLAAWEHAWRGNDAQPHARLFPGTLLAEPDHAIIAATRDGAVVAGCVASRSDQALGISNLFAPADDDENARATCLSAAMRCAPDRPLVGYESGDDLDRMTALGFTAIGPLRVWQAGD